MDPTPHKVPTSLQANLHCIPTTMCHMIVPISQTHLRGADSLFSEEEYESTTYENLCEVLKS